MAFSSDDLSRVESAIATGELQVSIGGQTIIYRTMRDLKAARDLIKGELEAAGVITARPRAAYATRTRD